MKNTKYTPKYYVNTDEVVSEISKHQIGDGMPMVLDNYNSNGMLYDELSKNKYHDFFTCFASLPLGYNHPKMMEEDFIIFLPMILFSLSCFLFIYLYYRQTIHFQK